MIQTMCLVVLVETKRRSGIKAVMFLARDRHDVDGVKLQHMQQPWLIKLPTLKSRWQCLIIEPPARLMPAVKFDATCQSYAVMHQHVTNLLKVACSFHAVEKQNSITWHPHTRPVQCCLNYEIWIISWVCPNVPTERAHLDPLIFLSNRACYRGLADGRGADDSNADPHPRSTSTSATWSTRDVR
eukprot:163855-Prymnesium_polylepis.3